MTDYVRVASKCFMNSAFFLPELIELEGLDPGPPRPRPVLAPRPLLPLRAPLSSPLVPRGRCSRSFASSGSEVLDSSEFATGSGKNRCRLMVSAKSKPDLASSKVIKYSHRIQSVGCWNPCAPCHGARSFEWCEASCCCRPSSSLCLGPHRGLCWRVHGNPLRSGGAGRRSGVAPCRAAPSPTQQNRDTHVEWEFL